MTTIVTFTPTEQYQATLTMLRDTAETYFHTNAKTIREKINEVIALVPQVTATNVTGLNRTTDTVIPTATTTQPN